MVNLWSRNKGGTFALKTAQPNRIQPIKEVEHLIQKKHLLATFLHLDFLGKTAGRGITSLHNRER